MPGEIQTDKIYIAIFKKNVEKVEQKQFYFIRFDEKVEDNLSLCEKLNK